MTPPSNPCIRMEIVVLADNEEDVSDQGKDGKKENRNRKLESKATRVLLPKGSMEMEISGANHNNLHLTTFCLTSSTNLAKTGLDSNLDTNLAKIGLDSKGRSLNIPVMIQMKDNRKLAPKIQILWIIERRKPNQKFNFLKQDQMNWKLKMEQVLIGCTLLPKKLMIKMLSKGEHDKKIGSLKAC